MLQDQEAIGEPNVSPGRHGQLSCASWATISASLVLGAVFLQSSVVKLYQPYEFLHAIYNYELVGRGVGVALAAILPVLELLVGASLVTGIMRRGALFLSILMLAMFAAAQSVSLGRGLDIPCGCFLRPKDVITARSLLFTLSMLAIGVLGYGCSLLSPPMHEPITRAIRPATGAAGA
jgi:uncharacterized membrane protein YphA (DoxX/SURF4 family)